MRGLSSLAGILLMVAGCGGASRPGDQGPPPDTGADGQVLLDDLEVRWTIEGGSSAGLCASYGIGHWHVVADGPERVSIDVGCDNAWDSGTAFYSVAVGTYDVTVEAVADGTGSVLASRSRAGVLVGGQGTAEVDVPFADADF